MRGGVKKVTPQRRVAGSAGFAFIARLFFLLEVLAQGIPTRPPPPPHRREEDGDGAEDNEAGDHPFRDSAIR